MEYNLRALTSADIFPMSNIISKIGIKEFKSCFESDSVKSMAASGKNAESVGMMIIIDIAGIILSNLSNCEMELYKFMSDVSGLKVDELKKAPMADFVEMIIALVQKEEFKDFFRVVSKLLKSE